MPKSLIDNWKFRLFGQSNDPEIPRFRGYISSIDPTTAGFGVMIGGSKNTYKSLLGSINNRPGQKRRGPADATQAGVKSSYEWQTSLGVTRVLRVANGKLQVEFDQGSGIQYFDLLTGLTDGEMDMSFSPWFSLSDEKDLLLFVNGQTELNMWSGGLAGVSAAAATVGIIGYIRNPNYSIAAPWGSSSGGIGYAVGDLLTITGGNGDARLKVDSISAATAVASVTIAAAGLDYTIGDIVSLPQISAGVFALVKITGVSGLGAVTAVQMLSSPPGYALASAQATTNRAVSGPAAGLTLDIATLGTTIETWHFTNNGSGYSTGDYVATTGGAGTGATIALEQVLTGRITISGSDTLSELGFSGTLTSTDGTNSQTGGTVTIDGVERAYTALGDDGFSFVGVDTSGISPGDAAVATVVTTATDFATGFTNDWINVIGNQVYIGCYTSRLVFVSSNTDYTDFTVPVLVLRAPGTPDYFVLDTNSRGATAKGGQKGNAVLFGSQGDSYSIIRTQETAASFDVASAVVFENVATDKQISSDLSSPIGQDFIDSIGDTIIFLDENNQLRQFGTLRNLNTPVYPILSLDVYTELAALDFTGGQLRTVAEQSGETVYVTCPLSSVTYIYQIREEVDRLGNLGSERLWFSPFIWNVSRIAVIDGVTYGYSNVNPQLYQLWETGQFYDDSPDDTSEPYDSHAVFAYLSLPERTAQLMFDKMYFEGYATRGTPLYCNIYQEYQGAKGIQTIVVNNPTEPQKKIARFYGSNEVPSLGDVSLGLIPLGMGVVNAPASALPKFRTIRNNEVNGIFEFALDVFSFDVDAEWRLLLAGTNMMDTPGNAAQLLLKN